MKKLFATLIAIAAFGAPLTAFATTQLFMGSQTINRAATSRLPLYGNIQNAGSFTPIINGVMPTGGTFSSFYAYVNNAPGGTSNWAVTIEDNSSTQSITCTITSAITSCNDLTNTFTAAAGDVIDVVFTPGTTPVATSMFFSLEFSPTTPNQTVWLNTSQNSTLSNSLEQYFPLGASKIPNSSETLATSIVPEGGTFSNMVIQGTASASPGTYTFFVKNFSANATTSITCVDSSTGCSDTTHTYATSSPNAGVIGDRMDIASVPAAPTARSRGGGIVFSPTVTGDFVYPIIFSNDSASAQRFIPFGSQTGAPFSTAEASSTSYAQPMTITDMQVYIDTASAAGKNRTFTIRKNLATTTAACTVAGGTNNCRWSGTLTVAQGDTLNVVDMPILANAPSATTGNISIIANIPTSAPAQSKPKFSIFRALKIFKGRLMIK